MTRKIVAAIAVLMLAGLLPRAGSEALAQQPTERIVLMSENTGAGDVFTEYGTNAQFYLLQTVVEPLVRIQLLPDGSGWGIVPVLAASWSQPDPKTLVVKLKEGVKFHNGEELTAEHVKYAFDTIVNAEKPTRRTVLLKPLGQAAVVDKYTIRWTMPEPNSFALVNTDYNLLIPPLARKTMTAEEFEKKPIGTGPYRAIEFARDKPVRLEAWDGYRLGKPTPERLTIRYVPDPSTRVAELLAGRAHIAQRVPIDALPSLKADPKLEVISLKGASTNVYPINVFKTTPPLRDKRVRQAMNYAVDREGIAKSILRGYGFAMPGPLWAGWMGHTDDISPFPYDPERAKALLREAGYPNGFGFEWLITRGVFQKDFEVGEAVANQLAKVGIKANLVPVERARMLAQRSTGNYDVWSGVWPMAWEPSQVWYFLLGSISLPDDKLTQWGATPPELVETRRLAREAAGARDLQERAQRQAQLVRLMHDEAFWLYVTVNDEIWGIQKDTRWRPYPATWAGDYYWYDYWAMIGKKAPTATSYDLLVR